MSAFGELDRVVEELVVDERRTAIDHGDPSSVRLNA